MTTSVLSINNNHSTSNPNNPSSVNENNYSTAQHTTIAVTASSPITTITTSRPMQSDEDFNIRFVNLVRTHKCLYDKKVPEYRNRDNQEKAWTLISQETRESVIHCKERWRNLRACLSRYIKQQSGTDPQHKPYYLTEHMAFLLPFLKSTRNTLDSNGGVHGKANLAALLHITTAQQQAATSMHHHLLPLHLHGGGQTKFEASNQLDMKHSLSEQEDEETIDAFDPVISASLQQQRCSPPLSDTASANTELQNFIPDVQLAELRTPDPPMHATSSDMFGVSTQVTGSGRRDSHDFNGGSGGGITSLGSAAKRIKTECEEATTTAQLHCYADMEFFRSIMPDIAALTPQQKRKFKIGILELIDDVVERYPGPGERGGSGSVAGGGGGSGVGSSSSSHCRQARRDSAREWRK